MVSILHAAVATAWAARLLQLRGHVCGPRTFVRRLETDGPNTRGEEALFRFSSGYWLADFLYLLCAERDPMFLAHHAVCLSLWPASLAHRYGAGVLLVATCLGEASTPLMGLWWLAKAAAAPAWLQDSASRAFTAAFLPIRAGVLPIYASALLHAAFSGRLDGYLGAVRARVYAVVMAASVGGGLVWARALIRGLLKANQKRALSAR